MNVIYHYNLPALCIRRIISVTLKESREIPNTLPNRRRRHGIKGKTTKRQINKHQSTLLLKIITIENGGRLKLLQK